MAVRHIEATPLDAILARQPIVVLDGALATELERRGADLRDPLWSAKVLLENPTLIGEVHRDYFAAGADVATTATYQATFEAFSRRGVGESAAAELMRSAVRIAVAARDAFWTDERHRSARMRPLVAASIGPYGAMLADGSEYRGAYGLSDRELAQFHEPRLRVLANAGADLVACETIPCLQEALVLARQLEQWPDVYAWIAFSCASESLTCAGEDVADCAAALQPFTRVAAIGVNCSAPSHVAGLIARMRSATDKPLAAYPNSGEVYDPVDKHWHSNERQEPNRVPPFADQAAAWYAAGATLIGGCCRTTPTDIAALRQRFF